MTEDRARPTAEQRATQGEITLSFETFAARAVPGALVPVWRDCLLDTDTPVSAFARLRRGLFAFLLESAPAGGETWARYTFMGTEPRGAWRLKDGVVEDWSAARGWHGARTPADPIEDLRAIVAEHQPVHVPELGAFWGGAVGFFGYDVVRHIEHLPSPPPRVIDAPDALFVFTGSVVIIDNLRAQARIVHGVPIGDDTSEEALRAAYESASAEIDRTIRQLRRSTSIRRRRQRPACHRTRRTSISPTSIASRNTSSPATVFRCCSRAALPSRTISTARRSTGRFAR
jgi:anthranilate synthase component 1